MATSPNTPAATTPGPEQVTKPVHTILLDSSPLLLNQPSISTLLANSHALITTPSVIAEIRGEEARSRLETLYLPFMTVRNPKPESVKLVKEFARKTGDAAVLSQTDFEVLGLAYDLECERNGGDWRLRRVPGQKRVNGSPPAKQEAHSAESEQENTPVEVADVPALDSEQNVLESRIKNITLEEELEGQVRHDIDAQSDGNRDTDQQDQALDEGLSEPAEPTKQSSHGLDVVEEGQEDDSDEGWITPSNIHKRQAKDEAASKATKTESRPVQVATMTGDFAMQNVLLQMNLNLLSTKTCKRIAQIKQFILRCHACFQTTKDMSKQFCPRCGQPALTRVSCTTNDKGEVKLHLKANMQWNNKGNVYSIPKPSGGSANQKWKGAKQGGGQGGWGNDLILAEDQKEYIRAMSSMKRTKKKDLMDEDLLPSILSGDRERAGGRPRVGAGRGVNSRKR